MSKNYRRETKEPAACSWLFFVYHIRGLLSRMLIEANLSGTNAYWDEWLSEANAKQSV